MTYGIIDSGLGGYRIYQALHKAYPDAAFVFLADQKNAPYGNKLKEDLLMIARKNMNYFVSQGIFDVIIACNTMNALVLKTLKEEFKTIRFYDVIEPTLDALKDIKHEYWLVLATQRTIDSKLYQTGLLKLNPQPKVKGVALPDLVSLIESLASEESIKDYLKRNIPKQKFDAVLLGCTHYPLITNLIQETLQAKVYDSEKAMVDSLASQAFETGASKCLTTGNVDHAQRQAQELFGLDEVFEQVRV